MRPSESTLRSVAPTPKRRVVRPMGDGFAFVGATLVEIHPPRTGPAPLVVRGDVIAQVGGSIPDDVPRVDVAGCLVMPAFVVAHAQAYLSLAFATPGEEGVIRPTDAFADSVALAMDPELVRVAALAYAATAAKAGVACILDHHASPRCIDGSLDQVESAFDEIGVRGALAYATRDGEGRGRRDAGVRENRRFLERVSRGESRHRGLAGVYVTEAIANDTLESLRSLADAFGVGTHVRLAAEVEPQRQSAPDGGASPERSRRPPLVRCFERGVLGRRGAVVADAAQLDLRSAARVTGAGGYLATSPRATMLRGVGASRAAGQRVAFGTAGLDADILAEARAYHLRHSEGNDGLARETGARIVAAQDLASAVFDDDTPRRLVPGARADLVVLEYDPMTPMAPSNIVEHLALGWTSARVRDTMVGGRFIVRDRKLLHVDERDVALRARTAARRLWERMQGYD